jgi:ribonuclease P protein component
VRKHGFSKSSRLTDRRQFLRLFQNPSTFKATTFQAFWKANNRDSARLGITIKGRLSSVWRMRLKRLVREWFRTSKEKIGSNDVNIVIRVPTQLGMDYIDLLKRQLRDWKA